MAPVFCPHVAAVIDALTSIGLGHGDGAPPTTMVAEDEHPLPSLTVTV